MTKSDPLRDQLIRFLDWKEAHVDFDGAIGGIPPDKAGGKDGGRGRGGSRRSRRSDSGCLRFGVRLIAATGQGQQENCSNARQHHFGHV